MRRTDFDVNTAGCKTTSYYSYFHGVYFIALIGSNFDLKKFGSVTTS